MKTGKKKKGFLYGMLFYAVVFICILTIGMIILWRYIEAYEKTRPATAMRAYMQTFNEEKVRYLVYDFLGTFDNNLQSREEIFDGYIRPMLGDKVNYKKNPAESNETKVVYSLLSDEQLIGSVTLEQSEKEEIGFRFWNVVDEQMDFSFIREDNSSSVTVPESFTVTCNGYTLGGKYLTGRQNDYDSLDYLSEYGLKMPDMVTYTVTDYLGDVEFRVYDEDGAEHALDENFENLLINRTLNNCSAEETERLTTFIQNYCKYYVAFMGSHRDLIYGNYANLKPYLLPGRALAARMNGALDGMTWSGNKSNEIQSMEINYIIRLEQGRYVCDITYFVNTLGNRGYVVTENNARVFVRWTDTGVFAEEMLSY
jgi:hypothetical protein